jgi:hypothetical protein
VRARDPNELAERAGVPTSYVDRLIELGIVCAGEEGMFSDADVYRVRFVWASHAATRLPPGSPRS